MLLIKGGIEQPKVQSVIGLFRGESVCTPDGIDCQETVDERDEYTLTRTEQMEDSPTKTFSEYEKGKTVKTIELYIVTYYNTVQ